YSERPDSSLISMIDHLIRQDHSGLSRFLPLLGKEHRSEKVDADMLNEEAGRTIADAQKNHRNVLLFGAAFGLLDWMDAGACMLPPGSAVIETGGMKTYRKAVSKEDLRAQLSQSFGISPDAIHSEYGMAEMCSQAWDTGDGWFHTPPWLRITVRNPENPLKEQPPGTEGLIGIMDLANVHSLSFLLSQDKGVARKDGAFRVLGRWEEAELRGCNFLME
ncbi:hypothetical protein QLX67_10145, partial [Balneolaceae bacterium ANBcel3]|nr:hypothetical protein [Balneolaceae bacterium ANBcel3]